jgi:dienelactone hydrolase
MRIHTRLLASSCSLVLTALAGAAAAAPTPAAGPTILRPTACDGFEGGEVSIVHKTSPVAGPNHRCDPGDQSQGCTIDYQGWVYWKHATVVKNRPALLYLHGHADLGQELAEPCTLAQPFVDAGYVVLMPIQRGTAAKQDLFPGMRSTGSHIDEWVAAHPCGSLGCDVGDKRAEEQITYLEKQILDIRDAIAWLKAQPGVGLCKSATCKLIAPSKIALMGHSFGGSMTQLANAASPHLGHKAAVNFSGAVLSWDSSTVWEDRLSEAVTDAQEPFYYFQAKNEGSLEPVSVLGSLARELHQRGQATLFGNVADYCTTSTCEPNHHVWFAKKPAEIEKWAPSVLAFLDLYLGN